jgi:hypothetical protein
LHRPLWFVFWARVVLSAAGGGGGGRRHCPSQNPTKQKFIGARSRDLGGHSIGPPLPI